MIFSFVFTPIQGLDLLSGISAFSHLIQGLVRFLVYVGREFPKASQVALVEKNPPASAGEIRDTGSIPGSGLSPGGGPGNHSSILAWRIPWTEEPVHRVQNMGLQRVR